MLVQLGDVLDRGDDEIAILSLLRSLDIQAKAKGGAVFQVCDAKSRTALVHFTNQFLKFKLLQCILKSSLHVKHV